ncbi:MAG: Spy/CpxP family protein refolding chaperone [Acidiferrobacterales bacterium]
MNRKSLTTVMVGILMALALGTVAPATLAHGGGQSMGGGGPGYGMGHMGMMGGGMMGGGMMGGGMMGMGPGMMGGGMMGGMGPGMMGMGPIGMLDLTDDQRTKIHNIKNGLRKQNWNTMGKIMDEGSKLRGLYAKEPRDPKAIGAVYGKIFDYKRQMIEAKIAAMNNMQAVLTAEQREQLKQWRHGRRSGPGAQGMPGRGMGRGMMGGG